MPSESKEWRRFLQPLVTGLVALVAALTLYVQRSDNDRTDSRITAIEVRMDAGEKRMDASDRRSDKFGADIDNFKVLLGFPAMRGLQEVRVQQSHCTRHKEHVCGYIVNLRP